MQGSDLHLDLDREQRCGVPEVVYAEGKSPEQAARAAHGLWQANGRVLVTRASADQARAIQEAIPTITHHRDARCLSCGEPTPITPGSAGIVFAGTSDLPVAEETRVTLRFLGHEATMIGDVGVAGMHRVLEDQKLLRRCDLLLVCAGMEGALPSVVGGLVSTPVIGIPTSVGYGTGLQGVAALMGMLNSCSPGLAVVNIDNGFGAGVLASKWLAKSEKSAGKTSG